MNVDFTVYDDTGRILQIGSVPENMVEGQASPGRNVLEGTFDAALMYVADGVAVARPGNPTQLTGTTLTNVPVPANVRINQAAYATNDATVELDLTYPSLYNIVVSAFPYQDKTFTVTT